MTSEVRQSDWAKRPQDTTSLFMDLTVLDRGKEISMQGSLDATLLLERQQRADEAQRKLEDRQWLRDFTLALVLIFATITVSTALSRWMASGQ